LWRLAKPEKTQTRRISGGVLTVERVLARIAAAQDASARALGGRPRLLDSLDEIELIAAVSTPHNSLRD